MCEPTTLALASFAMAAAGTAAQYQQSKYDAEGQNATNDRNYQAAMQAYRDNHAALGLQEQQEWESAQEQAEANEKDRRKTQASATVAAGEQGIMGNTVDSLYREIAGNAAGNQSSIYQNYLRANSAIGDQMRGERNRTESITNQLAHVNGPSALVAGLKIGSQAMGAYSGYKSGNFGNDGKQWKGK